MQTALGTGRRSLGNEGLAVTWSLSGWACVQELVGVTGLAAPFLLSNKEGATVVC